MIVAGMATMPDRLPYLEEVVETIRPQVDALRVYLNNFDDIPGFLQPDEAQLSDTAQGDLGAEGKFYWLDGKGGLTVTHTTSPSMTTWGTPMIMSHDSLVSLTLVAVWRLSVFMVRSSWFLLKILLILARNATAFTRR